MRGLLLALIASAAILIAAAKDAGECEVCLKVLNEVEASLSKADKKDLLKVRSGGLPAGGASAHCSCHGRSLLIPLNRRLLSRVFSRVFSR